MIFFKLVFKNLINIKKSFILMFIVSTLSSLMNAFTTFSLVPLIYFLLYGKLNFKDDSIFEFISEFINFSLQNVLILFISFFLFSSALKILADFYIVKIRKDLLVNIQDKFLKTLFKAEWHFFYKKKISTITSAIYKDLEIVGSAILSALHLISNIGLIIFLFVAPFIISFKLTLYMIFIGGILILPLKKVQKYFYRLGSKTTRENKIFTSIFQNTLNFFKIVIVNDKSKENINLITNSHKRLADIGIKSKVLNVAIHETLNFFMILIILISFFLAKKLDTPLPELAAIMYAFLRLIPILFNTIVNFNHLSNSKASYENIVNINEQAKNLRKKNGYQNLNLSFDKIKFNSVKFKYPNNTVALKNIDFEIKKNDFVGLIGKSGSGKSTILDVIAGLNTPNNGSVLIGKQDLKNINLQKYVNFIAYVDSNNHIFPMSIYENLKWANKNASFEDIKKILKICCIDDVINLLPNKIHTDLSDHGTVISAGQKQRICLARALIKKPKILLLDEATSHLDTKTEEKVMQNLKKLKNMTKIFATHNKNIFKFFNNKIYLKDGDLSSRFR